MKKTVLILIMTLVAVGLQAQRHIKFRTDVPQGLRVEKSTSQELSLHYAIQEFGIADIDNGEGKGQEIILKGNFGSFAAGLPNLPCENHYIAIPQGTTIRVEVSEKGHETLNNINLLPAAEVIENAAEGLPKLRKNMDVFGQDANFPGKNVSLSQNTKIRGLDVAILSITPFRYNPVQKTLEVVYDMDIDIHFDGGDGQFGEARYRNPDWDCILRDLVVNSDMLPEAHYFDLINQAVSNRDEGCEYLVISPDDEEILAWADTLKQFRTKQGILTKVVTVTECGGNNAHAIKNYIQNAYEHWTIPPASVMLLGGISETIYSSEMRGIPAFPLIFLNYSDTGQNYDYYSDNPYSDMNGDSIPDLALSRLPAYNIEEYKTEITKLIQFETNPPTDPEYYHHPIITSGYEDNKWFLITSQAVNSFYRNKLGKQPRNFYMVYQYSSNPIANPDTAWSIGYNTAAVVDYFGPEGQNYIAQSPDTLHSWRNMFDYSYLVDALNHNSFLTLYRDHSGSDLWCCPWIGSLDLLYLTQNTHPTFLLSIGCHTGEFIRTYFQGYLYNSPFIADFCSHEVGALGGIGASTVTHSHYNDILTWGVIDHFWPNFMPGLGSETAPMFTRPAYALAAGKLFLNQHVFMPNYWPTKVTSTLNVFHYLGEAYLNLYTEVPQPIAVEAAPFSNDQTTYTFTAEKGALVCLSDGDAILQVVQATGAPQIITFPNMPVGERIHLTITKQNGLRFEQEIRVVSPDLPFVYTQQFRIGNNGQMDAGEVVDIDLVLHNHSQIASDQGTLTLLCESPYVEVSQPSVSYASIRPEATLTIEKAFQIKISEDIPDQAPLDFYIQFNENENTHQDHFRFNANAPFLKISPEIQFLTAEGQPSTHIETEGKSSILFTVSNTGHSDARYLCATLDIKAPFVDIEAPVYTLQNLAPNEELVINYPLNTTPNSVAGAWLQTQLKLQYDNHNNYYDTIVQYGGIFENFEAEELNPFFRWTSTGSHKWDYCTEDTYEGQHCYMANAEPTALSVLKAQLLEPLADHYSKLSFHFKTGEGDTLFFYNTTIGHKTLLSSNEWQYAEVDYNGSDHNFIWSYKQSDVNSAQAKIDDICFPPLHTVIAYAGDDKVVCGDLPIILDNAYAYDYETVQWSSEGDGTFDDNASVNPVYTPGSQDLANGSVTLTLSAFGNDTIVSMTQIHFVDGVDLGSITGDSIVNKYEDPVSHYAIEDQAGIVYHWELEPANAGVIYGTGHEIDILWNPLESDMEITLSVTDGNHCSSTPVARHISLIGHGIAEWRSIGFELFPNPTDGKVNLVVEEALQGKTTIEVFNLLGERMAVKVAGDLPKGSTVCLDLSRLSPGLYIVRLNTKEGSLSKKVSLR